MPVYTPVEDLTCRFVLGMWIFALSLTCAEALMEVGKGAFLTPSCHHLSWPTWKLMGPPCGPYSTWAPWGLQPWIASMCTETPPPTTDKTFPALSPPLANNLLWDLWDGWHRDCYSVSTQYKPYSAFLHLYSPWSHQSNTWPRWWIGSLPGF